MAHGTQSFDVEISAIFADNKHDFVYKWATTDKTCYPQLASI